MRLSFNWGIVQERFASVVRAEQWWEYKLVPTLSCFYATALTLDRPITSIWQATLVLLMALVPGAVYVSVTNDIADRESDAAAGKSNRMVGKSRSLLVGLVALPVLIGVAFAIQWRDDPWLVAAYLAAWIVFSLYSVPPFRWKGRGLLGILADAAGAHLFPTLVAVLLACREAGRQADPVWLCAAGAWAFGYGLRGILWHQLEDLDNDRAAAVGTFAQRHSPSLAANTACYFAFPLEVGALTVLLWKLDAILPPLLLACYAVLVLVRIAAGFPRPVIVETRNTYSILLHEYYDVLLPASILLASAIKFPADLVVFAAHFLLFPQRATQVTAEALTLLRRGVRRFAYKR